MAPLPTIGNCIRVDLQWNTHAGVAPHNTFHIITASSDLEEIGEALGSAFDDGGDGVWGALSSSYTLNHCLLTDLSNDEAAVDVPLGTVIQGGGGGDILPAVAAVLSFRTIERGPKGRGRLYLGPITEAAQSNGLLDVDDVTAWRAAWVAVNDSLADSSINASLGVASYTHEEVTGVTSISMRQQVGTQRRRQNQLVH